MEKQKRSRKSALACRRRADLRLLRTALISAAVISLLPAQWIVTGVELGLITASIWGITYLLRDGV